MKEAEREPELPEAKKATLVERAGTAGSSAAAGVRERPALARGLRYGLVALVVFFLVFAIATQWRRLPDQAWRFEPGWLALSVAAFLTMLAINAEIWRVIVASLGYPMDRARARKIWASTLLARYVPTNALLVVGRVSMAAKEGVPQRVTVASIVYEVALGVAGALTVGAYAVIGLDSLQGEPLRYVVLALPIGTLAGLHPAIFHPVVNFAFARLGREPLAVSVRPRALLLAWGMYVLMFLAAGLGVYTFAQGIFTVSSEHIATVVSSWAVGFTVSVLAFVLPAGLGAREAGLVAALAPAMPTSVALAVAVAVRIFVTGVELLFAGLATLVARGRRYRAPA